MNSKIEKALNDQISMEFYSSNLYLAMASWAEVNGLEGTSRFLYKHAEEERIHMLKLIHFINERGGHGISPGSKLPPKTFKSVKDLFQLVLDHERQVTNEINGLVGLCLQEKDFTTHNFLQWYVTEQLEEENLAKTVLDKLNLIGKDSAGMYLFDRDIETISAPSAAGAQPAA
ncbi:MAG: ferritin [Bacteroidia bacterium]|nr:ferritin [Bacteroidia bacterium]